MNTAERRHTLLSLVQTALAFAGAGVAGTLWWAHRANLTLPCTAGGGCDVVAASRWAHVTLGPLHDVPLALCGFVSYLVLFTLAMAKWGTDTDRTAHILRVLLLTGTLAGTVFSWYLQWVAHEKLGAFCVWCRASALIMTALLCVTGVGSNGGPPPRPFSLLRKNPPMSNPVQTPLTPGGMPPVPPPQKGQYRQKSHPARRLARPAGRPAVGPDTLWRRYGHKPR